MNDSYELNFVLPKGLEGPTGPSNIMDSLISANYNDANIACDLSIKDFLIFPNSSEIFQSFNDYININQSGIYEFTISGYLKETTTPSRTSLVLKTNIQNLTKFNNLITVTLNNNKKESYFSYTKVGRYSTLQKVTLIFDKSETSDAYLKDVCLIIKKIPWPY